jgi:hypothetical protein
MNHHTENITKTIPGIVIMVILISNRFFGFNVAKSTNEVSMITPHPVLVADSALIRYEN